MSFQTHPFVMSQVAALRHAEFRAEADRYRLTKRAEMTAKPPRRWADLTVALVVVFALMLLLAAGSTFPEGARQPVDRHDQRVETSAVTHVVNDHFLAPAWPVIPVRRG